MDYKELKEQVREEWKRYYFFVRCDKYMVNAFNRSLDDLNYLKCKAYHQIDDKNLSNQLARVISEMMTLGKLFGKYKLYHRILKYIMYKRITRKFNKLP